MAVTLDDARAMVLAADRAGVVLLVGQVACTPLARDGLPERIARQPRVRQLLEDAAPIAQEGRWSGP